MKKKTDYVVVHGVTMPVEDYEKMKTDLFFAKLYGALGVILPMPPRKEVRPN